MKDKDGYTIMPRCTDNDAIVGTEYYGYSVKANGKLYKFRHTLDPIGKKSTKVTLYFPSPGAHFYD